MRGYFLNKLRPIQIDKCLSDLKSAFWETQNFADISNAELRSNYTVLRGCNSSAHNSLEFLTLTDRFSVITSDVTWDEHVHLNLKTGKFIMFSYCLLGHVTTTFKNGLSYRLDEKSAQVLIDDDRSGFLQVFSPKDKQANVVVLLTFDALLEVLLIEEGCLTKAVSMFLQGQLADRAWLENMDMQMMSLIADIIMIKSSPLRAPHIRAKVLELVSLHIQKLINPQTSCENVGLILSGQDIVRLAEAKNILTQDMLLKYSLPSLARAVGLNRTKLSTGFRQLYGETISNYVLRLKIDFVKKYIKNREGSLKELSQYLGYDHPSSLSAAIKNKTGMTSKELKKQLLSLQ